MRLSTSTAATALVTLIAAVSAQSKYPIYSIDQPIDHFPASDRYLPHDNGTFKQRYYFNASYYKPGGPVFLYIGGETDATERESNIDSGIIQILMQQFNGLGVILENRYYGESYPYSDSSTDHLVYLTTEQTIADNAYFATHVKFPGVAADLRAPGTPWILYGGSLAGAQTAFSLKAHGDVLFGGIAASGTIRAILAYPQWFVNWQEKKKKKKKKRKKHGLTGFFKVLTDPKVWATRLRDQRKWNHRQV